MAVVPMAFATTKQDLRVLSALCDTALSIYGAEKNGAYTVTMRFSPKSVSMSVMNSDNYKSPKEKILHFEDGHKLPNFFKKAGEYWSTRDEGPNILLIDVVYKHSEETGGMVRSFIKMEFFRMDKIEIHKTAEVIPCDFDV